MSVLVRVRLGMETRVIAMLSESINIPLYFSGTCGRNWRNIVGDSGEGARVPPPGVEGSAQSRWQCSRRPEEARLIYCKQLAATIFHLPALIWLFITLHVYGKAHRLLNINTAKK